MENTTLSNIQKLKLNPKLTKQLIKNQQLSQDLAMLVQQSGQEDWTEDQGKLVYELAGNHTAKFLNQKDKIVEYIISNKIKSKVQLNEAIMYMSAHPDFKFEDSDKIKDFENDVGVGLEYTEEDIQKYVDEYFEKNMNKIKEKPYDKGLMNEFKEGLKFADQKILIQSYNKKAKPIMEEYKKNQKLNKPKKEKVARKKSDEPVLKKINLKKLMGRGMIESLNTPEVMKARNERQNNKIITRFPPEPNGYLHIGHCKAIRFNFKVASDYDGFTNLRYDDTNPYKESQEYIDKIQENLKWLGYTPKNILHASDYFDQIYEHAITLIKKNKAFVCFLKQEEAKKYREEKKESPYRNTPIEENLKEFEKMRAGFYDEGEAVLRAKIDCTHPNPTMRDPPIYRVMYTSHPHSGDKWCVYPLYDFVHCISDSIEDISYSLCTLEFEIRRDLYYWFLNELDLYKPFVWEYSRMNLSYNVLSKRKLIQLVESKVVDGWDDPRLMTVDGIKRRGVPPEAINEFCDLISVTRRGNDKVLHINVFEFVVKRYLSTHCQHAFGVTDPYKVEIVNLDKPIAIEKREEFDYEFNLTKTIYVDSADVRKEDNKKFYGMAPGKIVRLRFGPFVKVLSVDDNIVKVEQLKNEDVPNIKKVKGILHWVSDDESVECEIREYFKLFNCPFPGKKTGNLMDDVVIDSKKVYKKARVPLQLANIVKIGSRYQFERKGYYIVDYDSDIKNKKLVWNLIIDSHPVHNVDL